MKVVETHDIGSGYDEYSGKGSVEISLYDAEGKGIGGVTICAGEPEDAVFYRDLDGALCIEPLLRAAYEAGKRGETYEYEFIDENAEEEAGEYER
ncbi:hypothetical protein LOZ80_15145 [Paenibacillus sp. HWE-109]|uniref:hypothetical protein n=1 Tax=Paenibacillus sp. HWE-109 TaxID=1306526 RepID=UPI001EDCCAB7|nr:hypothetical protein [Paenibacillus sp. HWE-109]UKS30196.1 hypothetical protein LOZ80_15145 [Paenibacillus sp. HWE-109]